MSITEIKGQSSDSDTEFKPAVPNLAAETVPESAPTAPLDGHTPEATLDLTGAKPVIDLRDKPVPEHPASAPAEPHVEDAQPASTSTGQHVEHSPGVETTQTVDATSNQPYIETPSPEPQKKGLLGFIKGIFSHDTQADQPVYPPVEAGMGAGFDPTTMVTEQRAAAKAHTTEKPEANKEQ